jgi:hypothetical protein
MEPWVGLGIGVVLGAALMVALKKLATSKTRDGDPEPIIIIGDGSVYFGSPTFADDWQQQAGTNKLVYRDAGRKIRKTKVNGQAKGQPNANGKNDLKCDFLVAGTSQAVLKVETDSNGKNISLVIDQLNVSDPNWVKTKYGWGYPLPVGEEVITLTAGSGQPQNLGRGNNLETEVC